MLIFQGAQDLEVRISFDLFANEVFDVDSSRSSVSVAEAGKASRRVGVGEISCLSRIVESGQIDILKHPVIETFLHMKWQMIRKFVYAYIGIYNAYLVTYTLLVLLNQSPSGTT